MVFNSKKDLTDWARAQFDKYNVRKPEKHTEQELIDSNPGVPVSWIRQHVKDRDNQ